MRIRSFHIDGFGIFSNLDVPALAPGLNIFLGENASGKSTCLDFFRTMLCGYPHPNSREPSRAPLKGGQAGGFLLLETTGCGLVRLTRRPGSGGGVKLSDQDGKSLDAALLETIMGGTTREVYRNVFAFSLSELQTLRALSASEVRNALYGASFGMGVRSPAAILKQLDDHLGKMFAPQGRKLRMNALLAQLGETRGALRAAQEESAQFDALSLRYNETEASLRALRDEQAAHKRERRALERRLGVWRQWEEWRHAGMALERLHLVADTFPTDGPARLGRAKERREEAARHVQTLEARLDELRAELAAVVVDEPLTALAHELSQLAERKGSCRNALAALPAQRTALAHGKEGLARMLGALGPAWTCERIRATNRSLFAREELERQAREMDLADQSLNAAAAQL
ncbi:MAG: AAA family ATPase, partial [Deltaproteobacteria bacterium]|nr:AAA family ATPase [Deltaproteobacteria bacterium]